MAERGMGRGLAAILSVSQPEANGVDAPGGIASTELRELPVDVVKPNKDQPRRQFDETSLQALADSVSERGVLQPVLVRPRAGGTYEIVAGERRWRAARLAGLDTVPAIVQDRDDATTLEVALVERGFRLPSSWPIGLRRRLRSPYSAGSRPRSTSCPQAPSCGASTSAAARIRRGAARSRGDPVRTRNGIGASRG